MPAKKHTHNNDSGKKNFLCVCAEIFHFPMPNFQFWCVGYPTFRKRGLQITAMWLATRCWEITGNSVSTEVSESLIVMWRSIGTCTQYVLPVRGIFSCPAPIQCVISRSVVLTACFSPLDGVERLAVVWSTRLHPYTTWEESCRWANFCDVSRGGLSLRFFVARFVFFAFSLFRYVAFSFRRFFAFRFCGDASAEKNFQTLTREEKILLLCCLLLLVFSLFKRTTPPVSHKKAKGSHKVQLEEPHHKFI